MELDMGSIQNWTLKLVGPEITKSLKYNKWKHSLHELSTMIIITSQHLAFIYCCIASYQNSATRLSKNCIHNLGLSGLKGRTTFHDDSLKYSQSLVVNFSQTQVFGAPTLQHVELEKFKRMTGLEGLFNFHVQEAEML